MARPIYTPAEKIKTSLYTSGKELMFADTNKEYIGLYHQYPNNSIYSEAEYNTLSKELVLYSTAIETEISGKYYELTKKRFNNYVLPEYYYPVVTESDYKVANITRYFVQRRNNLSELIEINSDAYNNINRKNETGIDAGLYRKTAIQWSISGPIDDVRTANERIIKNSIFNNLSEYLTDLTEFYK